MRKPLLIILMKLKYTSQVVGILFLLFLLAAGLRLALLPFPIRLWAGLWTPPTTQPDARQVVRTVYYRGFLRPCLTFDQARSRAILTLLQDSTNYRGDTTPNISQMLVYYDAEGRVLSYTDLDLLSDEMAVVFMYPGDFQRGSILGPRPQLLRLLEFKPPFTAANLRRQ